MEEQVNNKRALITGFSSGIGFCYAKYLSERGWHLDLISQNEDRSNKALQLLNKHNCIAHILDLRKQGSINHIIENLQTPDLIVANAGIAINGAIGKNTNEDIHNANYLMFEGVVALIENFIPKMKIQQSGRIVIISSIGALVPMPKSSIYSAIKAGIYAYGKSISEELKYNNISITVSLPGYVKTNIHKRSGLGHLERQIPSWMWVSPEQVVKETEAASLKGKTKIIPGKLYRFISPFLNLKITQMLWNIINTRR